MSFFFKKCILHDKIKKEIKEKKKEKSNNIEKKKKKKKKVYIFNF